ncbi:GntR family transcriptional regulator [Phaeobacter sp. C3_T13_0]|uniref:GntR family transcriptional regulator n=1 Tax=Phaeobacter cretensis TaxID=3342641 RepID=UPI0039BD782E
MQRTPVELGIDGLDGTLGHRVYTVLRDQILNMSLEPGFVLRKGALCEQLGVSRSPVAEALGKLSSEGLVDIVPQSATRVSRLSLTAIQEESFLREAIEVAAVAKIANERSEEQLCKLSRNLRLQTLLIEDGDHAGFFEADVEFHNLILQFTGFPKVIAAADHLSLQLLRARMLLLPTKGRPKEAVEEHQAILDAIKAKDSKAARASMAIHLRQLIDRLTPLETTHPEFFRKA